MHVCGSRCRGGPQTPVSKQLVYRGELGDVRDSLELPDRWILARVSRAAGET
ncbi:MAG: hypothetical protein KY433_12905 [Actinobacteria bacterium]|nr:hypothetical protein [Actinomycetota bacterium]